MAVTLRVFGKKESFESDKKDHAEQKFYRAYKEDTGTEPVYLEMDAYPCVGKGIQSCHGLFLQLSLKRTITLRVTTGHGEFASDHGLANGTTGTITYTNGVAGYNPPTDNPPKITVNAATAKKDKSRKKAKDQAQASSSNGNPHASKRR